MVVYYSLMTSISNFPRLKGFSYPREIISYAVWTYHRFAMSAADVEDLLAERGVIVSRETVQLWVNRFGSHFAHRIKRDRPKHNNKWHLDEVVITIRGKKYAGLMPSEMKRLKQLEEENSKLKNLVVDLSLDRAMLQDVIKRKL